MSILATYPPNWQNTIFENSLKCGEKHKIKSLTLLLDMNLLAAIAKHAVKYLDLGVDLRPFSAVYFSLSADGDIMLTEERQRRPLGEELRALFDYFNSNNRIKVPMAKICEMSLATSDGQSYIGALQSAAEISHLKNKES